MKVAELRKKLARLSKDEISMLAVELYKIIPKAKKEDYGLDDLINNPTIKKKRKKKKQKYTPLSEIKRDIPEFIKNAETQNYIAPNRNIPKRERSKWRFKVMRWYKELINTRRADADVKTQAKLLSDLYEVLCKACGYYLFSTDDPFRSVQIEQHEFYKSVLLLIEQSEGKAGVTDRGIPLMINNDLDRETLYSTLGAVYLSFLTTPDLKTRAIENTVKLIKETNFDPNKKEKTNIYIWQSDKDYRKEYKNNELAKLGFRLYCSLYDTEEAIRFFKEYYWHNEEEVKIYVLTTLLFEQRLKEEIKRELREARQQGIRLRNNLLRLLSAIEKTDTLPEYIY